MEGRGGWKRSIGQITSLVLTGIFQIDQVKLTFLGEAEIAIRLLYRTRAEQRCGHFDNPIGSHCQHDNVRTEVMVCSRVPLGGSRNHKPEHSHKDSIWIRWDLHPLQAIRTQSSTTNAQAGCTTVMLRALPDLHSTGHATIVATWLETDDTVLSTRDATSAQCLLCSLLLCKRPSLCIT